MRRLPIIGSIVGGIALIIGGLYLFVWRDPPVMILPHTQKSPPLSYEAQYTQRVETALRVRRAESEQIDSILSTHDITKCRTLTDTTLRQLCEEQIATDLAMSGDTTHPCQTLSGSVRSDCEATILQSEALRHEDLRSCEKISDKARADLCRESVSRILYHNLSQSPIPITEEGCTHLSGTARIACEGQVKAEQDRRILDLSIESGDIGRCIEITSDVIRSECQDIIETREALKMGTPSLCEKVHGTDRRNACQQGAGEIRDTTDYTKAIQTDDITLCREIAEQKLADQCHDTLLIRSISRSKDRSLCSDLIDKKLISSCKTTQ